MNMIERVSQELSKYPGICCYTAEELAKAAVKAMVEPSEDMVRYGVNATIDNSGNINDSLGVSKRNVVAAYKAMIRSVIEEFE